MVARIHSLAVLAMLLWGLALVPAGPAFAQPPESAALDEAADNNEAAENDEAAESPGEDALLDSSSEDEDSPPPEPWNGGSAPGEPRPEDTRLAPVPPAPGATDNACTLSAVVMGTTSVQVDALVARHVTARARNSLRQLGYTLVSPEDMAAASARVRISQRPTPAELWQVTYASQAHRGIAATVWAEDGEYVYELVVASLDGTGPFFARGTSSAEDLHRVVGQLVETATPPCRRWNQVAYAHLTQGRFAAETEDAFEPDRSDSDSPSLAERLGHQPTERRGAPERPEVGRRFSLALQSDSAIGTSGSRFYNHMLGARIDYRITHEIIAGIYLGYANLKGRNGRANNLLAYGQIENRIRLGRRRAITIPLRFALGYLPYNGPVIRLGAGFNFPIGERLELGVELLSPSFWVLEDRTAVSLNLATELLIRL